jgi:hypothetical protein
MLAQFERRVGADSAALSMLAQFGKRMVADSIGLPRFALPQPSAKSGSVEGIFGERLICGWAYEPKTPAAKLSLEYRGTAYQTITAGEYRKDLKAAGIGRGYHSFSVPVPFDPLGFQPSLFEVRFQDGTPLSRTETFRCWRDIDLLSSPYSDVANIEFTSRCNLRCVYCPVSQPGYDGRDMETDDFDAILNTLRARKIQRIMVSGHGETTLISGWHHRIVQLAKNGFELNIITNFARLLSDDELAAMARISMITVSVDTHRPELLRQIRRRVSLGNILINMTATVAKAAELGLPPPTFAWSCVVSDKVAPDIVDYTRFGLACGVRVYQLCNLTKYPDVDDAENVEHVIMLSDEKLKKFAKDLEEMHDLIKAAGGSLNVPAGLPDSVKDELSARGIC